MCPMAGGRCRARVVVVSPELERWGARYRVRSAVGQRGGDHVWQPQSDRRLRRGAASTAVAALVLAALTASQAPGATEAAAARKQQPAPPPADTPIDGDSPYYTDLPPLNSPAPPREAHRTGQGTALGTGPAEAGIPATVLAAYKKAERPRSARPSPGCKLPWQLLAGHRQGRVRPGARRRVDAERHHAPADPRPAAQRQRLRADHRHRQRRVRRRQHPRPRRGPDAVHPVHLGRSTAPVGAPTATATARRTPTTSTTRRSPPATTSAPAAATCRSRPTWTARSSATTTPRSTCNTVLSWLEYYRKGTHEVPDGTGVAARHRGGAATTTAAAPAARSTATLRRRARRRARARARRHGKPGKGPRTPGKPGGGTDDPGRTDAQPTHARRPPPRPPSTVGPPGGRGYAQAHRHGGRRVRQTIATVRAETAAGKAVAKVRVRFTIVGDTDARFTGGESVATVTVTTTTPAWPPRPRCKAGEKTGAFTVRATVVGRTVARRRLRRDRHRPRQADTLARTARQRADLHRGRRVRQTRSRSRRPTRAPSRTASRPPPP